MLLTLKFRCKKCGQEYGEEPEKCWASACYCTAFEEINKTYTA